MKNFVSFVCFLSVLVVVSSAPFLPGSSSASLQTGNGDAPSTGGGGGGNGLTGLTNILSQIDLPGLLRGVNSFVKLVGVFCPPLSQVLDNVIQNVTSIAFRTFGRAILSSGGLGGSGSSGGGEQRVSVVLPTFPPDDYDEDEDEDTDSTTVVTANNEDNGTKGPSRDAVGLIHGQEAEINSDSTSITSSTQSSDENTISQTLFTSAINEDSNNIAKRHVRVAREAEDAALEEVEDTDPAESNLDEVELEQDRNKRFLPFGGHDDGHAGGGSGNFLFDLVRNTADRAARTIGTVYRMVAGTDNSWGSSPSSPQTADKDKIVADSSSSVQLVAGSGATEESDEKANAPGVVEVDVQKSAADHEGIPGPITRLFVIANRGVANLVQDLILRLAQTSERLVNFKARLITSLI